MQEKTIDQLEYVPSSQKSGQLDPLGDGISALELIRVSGSDKEMVMQKNILEQEAYISAIDGIGHLDPLGDGISSLELIRVSGSDVDVVGDTSWNVPLIVDVRAGKDWQTITK